MSPIVVILLALLIGCGTPLAILFILWWANRERERHPGQYAAWLEENPLPHSPTKPRQDYIVWDAHGSTLPTENDVHVEPAESADNNYSLSDTDYPGDRVTNPKLPSDWHVGWTRSRDSVGAGRRSRLPRR